MSFLQSFFGLSATTCNLENPSDCPNCWGRQEYDNTFHELLPDLTKSNINHNKLQQKAFILQFVETNVTGIRLRKGLLG